MIYLLTCLVLGFMFIISGKVQFRQTVYLEGTKAKLAGLIFLVPIGALLVSFLALAFLAILNININDKAIDDIASYATSLTQNFILIGLGYVGFNNISSKPSETKTRDGCLKYWLIYLLFLALLGFYFGLSTVYQEMIIGKAVVQLIAIIGIWFWKKWGVWVYVILIGVTPVITYIYTGEIIKTGLDFLSSLTTLLVAYLVVKPKWNFFTWK